MSRAAELHAEHERLTRQLSDALRAEARRIRREAAAFAGDLGLSPAEVPVAIDGVVICGQIAHRCYCTRPAAEPHTVHRCDPAKCIGQWRGSWADGTFAVVTMAAPS